MCRWMMLSSPSRLPLRAPAQRDGKAQRMSGSQVAEISRFRLQFDCLCDNFSKFAQGWRSSAGRASDL
jgi:hypothetical protein